MTDNELDEAYLRKSRVRVNNHDYEFEGVLVTIFTKKNNKSVRVVVEDDNGLLLIQSAKNLELVK